MRIRPGRTRSLVGGIMFLLITILGFVMMSSFPGGGPIGIFMIVWLIFGVVGAGISFYNALSERGVALYEVDTEHEHKDEALEFCPECGREVSWDDEFCRHCGADLRD
jgi:ribosomal protein S27AE